MEASDLSENFASRCTPDVDIDEFALSESLFLTSATRVARRAIELLASHLARGHDVFVGVHRHSDDVLVVQVEELLFILLHVLDYTDTSRGENDVTVGRVSQIAASIETAEPVRPLESQVAIRGLTHDPLELEIVWHTSIDLTTPDIDASALITFVHLNLTEFFAADLIKAFVFGSCLTIFIKACFIFIVSDGCGLGSSLIIHEVLPLEDCFVLATSGDQVLLAAVVSAEAHIGDMLRMACVLLVRCLIDGTRVLEEFDHAEVIARR